MRINKYIATAGVASRRKADEMIASGRVKVNNMVLREPGYDVMEGDLVEVDGKPVLQPEGKQYHYYALHKPVGYVTTVSDEKGRPTVMDLMTEVEGRIFPVGRLDIDTSGLLIMTDDGSFAYKVSHPKHEQGKTYVARVQGTFNESQARWLRKGIDIGGFVTSPAEVKILKELPRQTVVELTIHEGKYHQVRRMFKAAGFKVLELQRIAIGDVRLGRLAEGHYRRLKREEIDSLLKSSKK